MRTLLIFPNKIDGSNYWCTHPIGIGYLAKSLKMSGFDDVAILDLRLKKNRISPEDLPKLVMKKFGKPDIVGFTMFSNTFSSVLKYSEFLKKKFDCIVLVGGPHALFEPQDILKRNPYVDIVFNGEGEETLPELIRRLQKGEAIDNLPNISFRKSDQIVINERKFIEDLDKFPMPEWDLIEVKDYPLTPVGIFTKRKKVASVITTRGCPYPCTYCGAPKSMGKKIRKRSPENVVQEIEYLVSKYGIEEIHFWDDNITFEKEHIINLCRAIKQAGLHKKIVWACSNGVRLDRLDPEIVKEMESAGCYYFLVGIESGSDRVLKLMRRAQLSDTKSIREKIEIVKKHSKIRVLGAFIIGFPGATPQDDEESIRFALSLPIDKVAFNTFMPYPGSEEYNKLKLQGININIDEMDYHKPKAYIAPGRNEKEIKRKVLKGLFLFYIRPKILFGILKEIKSLSQIIMIIRRLLK